jgi:Holliday junction resolvasome RuvABC endonuclease subunit
LVSEYAPKKVKQAITGNGNADKDQVLENASTYFEYQKNNPNIMMLQMPYQLRFVIFTKAIL